MRTRGPRSPSTARGEGRSGSSSAGTTRSRLRASARCPTRSCRWDGARPCRGLAPAACTSSSMSPTTPTPGTHRGTLTLHAGSQGLHLNVSLTVWDFTLPDRLSFLPEMNCYGLPENERAYYRMAHRHRTVLNRLPYNQNGAMQEGCARLDGERLDWSAWDRRFGPVLDGSAFADLPRGGARRVLLSPLARELAPRHGGRATTATTGPTGPSGVVSPNVRGGHAADRRALPRKGLGRHPVPRVPQQQGRLQEPRAGRAGRPPGCSTSRPASRTSSALRYFARAFHEGVNQARLAGGEAAAESPRMVFRADISRPQWRRDALDGLLDYHVVGSAMRTYPRLVFERQRDPR